MGNQHAGRAEVIPSLVGAEGPERGGERMDTTEASRDYAAAQDAAADGAGALGAQQRADIAWPRLRVLRLRPDLQDEATLGAKNLHDL